jgi:membrane protein YdbS with pleckstrin-like domain
VNDADEPVTTKATAGPVTIDAEQAPWQGVDPRLASIRRIGWALWLAPCALVAMIIGWIIGQVLVWWSLALAIIVLMIWQLIATGRRVRAIGYRLDDGSVWIKHGLLFRRVSVIPYVRIQYVDVNRGPLERAVGLASISINTAAAALSGRLNGLTADQANNLRDWLTDPSHILGTSARAAAAMPTTDIQ